MVLSLSFITYRINRGMLKTYHFFCILQARFLIFLIFFKKLRFFNKLFLQKIFIVLFLFCFNFLESLFIIEQNKNESRKDSRIESAFYRFCLAAICFCGLKCRIGKNTLFDCYTKIVEFSKICQVYFQPYI